MVHFDSISAAEATLSPTSSRCSSPNVGTMIKETIKLPEPELDDDDHHSCFTSIPASFAAFTARLQVGDCSVPPSYDNLSIQRNILLRVNLSSGALASPATAGGGDVFPDMV
jgi:hypothetical protein